MSPIKVPYEFPGTVEIQRKLRSEYFPAEKHELIDRLRERNAAPAFLSVLYLLPARRYRTVDEVSRVLGSLKLRRENVHPAHYPGKGDVSLSADGRARTDRAHRLSA